MTGDVDGGPMIVTLGSGRGAVPAGLGRDNSAMRRVIDARFIFGAMHEVGGCGELRWLRKVASLGGRSCR